jgi:hypothetical protein
VRDVPEFWRMIAPEPALVVGLAVLAAVLIVALIRRMLRR